MSIGLDIGAFRMRSLRRGKGGLAGRACPALYALLPDSAGRRDMLERGRIPFARCGDELVLMGDAAAEAARLFQVPCRRLLPDGRLAAGDPLSRQVLGALLDSLLPPPAHPGEVCCLSLGGCLEQGPDDSVEGQFFTRLVRLRGYRPVVLDAGTAVVLAELVGGAFTGIGATFGASGCRFTLARHGTGLAGCTAAFGGDWIDARLAEELSLSVWDRDGRRHVDVDAARRCRCEAPGTLVQPVGATGALSARLHSELLVEAVACAADAFAPSASRPVLPRPLTLVAGGGLAQAPGFAELLLQTLDAGRFPLKIGQVRIAADADYTVARGCLIHAELEPATERAERRAA